MECFVEGLALITKVIVHITVGRCFGYYEGTIRDQRDTWQARNEELNNRSSKSRAKLAFCLHNATLSPLCLYICILMYVVVCRAKL